MADEKWQKVKEIFDVALRQTPEERPKYISEVCGEDKTLLAEIESLFSSLDKAEDFMEENAVAQVANITAGEKENLETGKHFGHTISPAPTRSTAKRTKPSNGYRKRQIPECPFILFLKRIRI